jgi:hypothetical protein
MAMESHFRGGCQGMERGLSQATRLSHLARRGRETINWQWVEEMGCMHYSHHGNGKGTAVGTGEAAVECRRGF